jgi:hypothetical protein
VKDQELTALAGRAGALGKKSLRMRAAGKLSIGEASLQRQAQHQLRQKKYTN